MSLQNRIKSVTNDFLSLKGHIILPKYELDFVIEKNRSGIEELTSYFLETKKISLPNNKLRIELMSRLYGTGYIEALYIIYSVNKSLLLNGDICEMGIANGATSTLLANEIRNSSKKLWLYDSFQGLSQPTIEDSLIDDIFNLGEMQKYGGSMNYSQSEVLGRLSSIRFPRNRTKIIKGFIEDTSKKEKNFPAKIAFAYIDFDLYSPIKTGLNAIHQRIVKNGIVIVDDYDFFSSGVKKAVDEFLRKKGNSYKIKKSSKSEGHFIVLEKK